uniref:Gustatory receptor n=1 Tax=Tetranychus urticae TaxID=32264 RepID=T1KSC9_TETUR
MQSQISCQRLQNGKKCSKSDVEICASCRNVMENKAIEHVETLEYFLNHLFIVRSSYKQSQHERSTLMNYFELNHRLIQLSVSLNLVRFAALLIFNIDTISILLGDPFFKFPGRKVVYILVIILALTMGLFREYVLHLESKGCLQFLSTFALIKKIGFDKRSLKMTDIQLQKFRHVFYTVGRYFSISMKMCLPLIVALMIGLRLNNEIYSTNLSIWLTSIFWILTEVHALYFAICGVVVIACHIIMVFPIYYYQMMSLVELLEQFSLKEDLVTAEVVRGLSANTIRFMNEFDQLNDQLKHLISYVFVVFSFTADYFIFSATIMQRNSALLSTVFFAFGAGVLSIIGFETFILGGFITKLNVIHALFLRLMRKSKIMFTKKSKPFEVLSRITGPYNGFKIGDMITVNKTIFVYYLVENASIIMLLSVNIRPFLE